MESEITDTSLNSLKSIISTFEKAEVLEKEIEKLETILNSNTFIMTVFLAGELSVDNYIMSITSDNVMVNNNGELYQTFIENLIKDKKKELLSYKNVLKPLTFSY